MRTINDLLENRSHCHKVMCLRKAKVDKKKKKKAIKKEEKTQKKKETKQNYLVLLYIFLTVQKSSTFHCLDSNCVRRCNNKSSGFYLFTNRI